MEKVPFRCLVEPRLALHFLPNAVDLLRFTGVFIFARHIVLNMIKISFLQKFVIFLVSDFLIVIIVIYKHQSV